MSSKYTPYLSLATFARRVGSKDKTKRKSRIASVLKGSLIPSVGALGGAVAGVGGAYLVTKKLNLPDNPVGKTASYGSMLVSGMGGSYIGRQAGIAVNNKTLNRKEKLFTPKSRVEKYKITKQEEAEIDKKIFRRATDPTGFLGKI